MAVHRTTPYNDGIECYQLTEGFNAGRWINRQLVDGKWQLLPGSGTYSNRTNANAGLSRYRVQHEVDKMKYLRQQVMAKQWGKIEVSLG